MLIKNLLITLCNLYYEGRLERLLAIKNCSSFSITDAGSTEAFVTYVLGNYFEAFCIKLPGESTFERAVEFHKIVNFRLNKKSLVIAKRDGSEIRIHLA